MILQRYLSPLLPLSYPLVLIALGLCAELIAYRRVPGAKGRLAAIAIAALVLPIAVIGGLWIAVGSFGAGGRWEEELVLSAWRLGPAAALTAIILLWDLWVDTARWGRLLFPPILALWVLALFWSQAQFATSLLGHPSWYAAYALGLAILTVAHQVATEFDSAGARPDSRTRRAVRRRSAIGLSAFVLVLVLSLGLVYRGWQNRAVEAGGGLMRPTAFQFDFADYIQLEPEIQQNQDLVFLYREDEPPADRLLRRYVLSGYSPRRGFYRLDPEREPSEVPPLGLSEAAAGGGPPAESPAGNGMTPVEQEYYLVNFDPNALIAVQEPVSVERLRTWADASFNSAYRVDSRHPDQDLAIAADAAGLESLPSAWREVYTGGRVPDAVAELAAEVTEDAVGYRERVDAVLDYLLSNYYYSLSPGEAVGGDQLTHFLFESRKGYCSYFAFSMTLMLRSLDIPSRVAVGFFVAPGSSMLGFHPIRGDMAHAWVEVWFDGVGWVEFDPTSWTIAPGETVNTNYQIDRERLASLVQEILEQGELGAETDRDGGASAEADGVLATARGRRASALILVVVLFSAWYGRRRLVWRSVRRHDPRRAVLALAARSHRQVPLTRQAPSVAEAVDRARFAQRFGTEDAARFENDLNRVLSRIAGARASTRRERLAAWISAYLAARLLPPSVRRIPKRNSTGVAPRRRRAGASTAAVRGVLVFALLVGGMIGPELVAAQSPAVGPADRRESQATADELVERINRATDAENYRRALHLIRTARHEFPEDARFAVLAGDLYYDQELFQPALRSYREALSLGAPSYSTRYIISRSLSRLNRDREAIAVLEALHREYRDDLTVIEDLAWQYFKVHRLEEARALLESTIEEFGADADLAMMLATVYSGLWNYDEARAQYESAIVKARRHDDRVFLAVAYYNLSILHANFSHYERAREAAERSMEMVERARGYMIRAELHELALRIESAADDYARAAVLDEETPLADLSLVSLWTDTGHPDRALARLDTIEDRRNDNWMYRFGIDPGRFRMRLYREYSEAYEAAANRDRLYRPGNLGRRVLRRIRGLYRRGLAWYYRGLYRAQAREVADAYSREGRNLLADWNRMHSAELIPGVALRYAHRAESREVRFRPEARLDYELFEAQLTDDRGMLAELVPELDSKWRAKDRASALRSLYRTDPRGRSGGFEAAARAYAQAPGGFLVNGLRVPVRPRGSSEAPLSRRRRTRALSRLGFKVDESSPLVLELDWSTGRLEYRVWDSDLAGELARGEVRFGDGPRAPQHALAEMAASLTQATSVAGAVGGP